MLTKPFTFVPTAGLSAKQPPERRKLSAVLMSLNSLTVVVSG
jgi:hypothetical protein